MSGGSFNYLYSTFEVPYELTDMADELSRIAPESKAAKDTAALVKAMTDASNRLDDVWHDVEWYKSRDYALDQALDAIARYEREE